MINAVPGSKSSFDVEEVAAVARRCTNIGSRFVSVTQCKQR